MSLCLAAMVVRRVVRARINIISEGNLELILTLSFCSNKRDLPEVYEARTMQISTIYQSDWTQIKHDVCHKLHI